MTAAIIRLRTSRAIGSAILYLFAYLIPTCPSAAADRPPPSPLDSIQPDHWLAEYTSDLIDPLNVLGRVIALEPAQAGLMELILKAELIKADHLKAALADDATDN